MSRRSELIPFASWLTSRDPAVREKAETALYHLGPDAGSALFASAEHVTSPTEYHRILAQFVVQLLIESAVAVAIISLFSVGPAGMTVIWCTCLGSSIGSAGNRMLRVALTRRHKLKVLGLALAKLNDLRAIGPLLEAWRPQNAIRGQRADDDIELELARLMPIFLRQKSFDLRTYKKRRLRHKTRRLFSRRVVRGRLVHNADLSDQRADVVVGVLQMLSRSSSDHDRALLERISRIPADKPNGHYVRDAAVYCLQRKAEILPPADIPVATASPPTPVGVGPAPVVIRR